MELYQFVWGAFALLVVWSVFFMPPVYKSRHLFILSLKAQILLLLAGFFAGPVAIIMYGNPHSIWPVFGLAISPVYLITSFGIMALVFCLVYLSISSALKGAVNGSPAIIKTQALKQERFPIRPSSAESHAIAIRYIQKVLKKGEFGLYELEPLPYATARPGPPNAFAIGMGGEGLIAWTGDIASTLHANEFASVIVHEAAHIKNRDSERTIIALLGKVFVVLVISLGFLFLNLGPPQAMCGFLLANMLKDAMSRKIEALADQEVITHGLGNCLADALRKITFEKGQRGNQPRWMYFFCSHPHPDWRTSVLRHYHR